MELPVGAIITVVYALLSALIGVVWRRCDATQKELADFKIEIARNHPSRGDWKEFREEMKGWIAEVREIVEELREEHFQNQGRNHERNERRA